MTEKVWNKVRKGMFCILAILFFLTGYRNVYGSDEDSAPRLRNGDRIRVPLTENVLLDAVAEIPDTDMNSVKMYQVVEKGFDGKKMIINLLGRIPEDMKREESDFTEPRYTYRGDLGENWKNAQGFTSAGDVTCIETDHWRAIRHFLPVERMGNEIITLFDDENKNPNFSFCTRKEAADSAEKYIKEITGFHDIVMYQAFSFDFQQIGKMQEYVLQAPENEQAKENAETVKEWNEDDNCYWMFFGQQIDSIPILNNTVYRQDLLYVPVSRTEVGFTEDGIEYLLLDNCYEIIDEKNAVIAPVENIYEALRRKYEMTITENVLIDQMKFIYFPLSVKRNDKSQWICDMIPTWQFRFRVADYTDYFYINASDCTEIVG